MVPPVEAMKELGSCDDRLLSAGIVELFIPLDKTVRAEMRCVMKGFVELITWLGRSAGTLHRRSLQGSRAYTICAVQA